VEEEAEAQQHYFLPLIQPFSSLELAEVQRVAGISAETAQIQLALPVVTDRPPAAIVPREQVDLETLLTVPRPGRTTLREQEGMVASPVIVGKPVVTEEGVAVAAAEAAVAVAVMSPGLPVMAAREELAAPMEPSPTPLEAGKPAMGFSLFAFSLESVRSPARWFSE